MDSVSNNNEKPIEHLKRTASSVISGVASTISKGATNAISYFTGTNNEKKDDVDTYVEEVSSPAVDNMQRTPFKTRTNAVFSSDPVNKYKFIGGKKKRRSRKSKKQRRRTTKNNKRRHSRRRRSTRRRRR